ncbi:MAG: LysR family transcriptional regulator [Rhodobacteraceae bacterium]|nr:LysR family transcriptional regulator [Paracoccaceae bacterium]
MELLRREDSAIYRLSDVDIRMLRVFMAIVESQGLTNAQAILNIGQPTISNHLANLEGRLGIKLCYRGRGGFRLTSKGEQVYEEAVRLLKVMERFENVTMELKGSLRGYLNVAVIDSAITDTKNPVISALETFNSRSHEVTVRLEVMTPFELGRAVLDLDVDVAVGTFDHHIAGLEYRPIYVESNELYCGRKHPLYRARGRSQIRKLVREAKKVTRTYLEGRDLYPLGHDDGIANAQVRYLEAAAILILAGGHVGFLPKHYAQFWVHKDEMRCILPEEYKYRSQFYIVTRKSPRKSVILDTFLRDLNDVVAGHLATATSEEMDLPELAVANTSD